MTARPTPDELRRGATAVYVAVPEEVANDLSAMLTAGADAMERVERLEKALWEMAQQGGHPTDETWCQRKASAALAQEGGDE